MATRRALLGQVGAALGVLACRAAIGQPAARAAYIAVETSEITGKSQARLLGPNGAEAGRVPLEFRAHGLAKNGDTLVVFPRRPGDRFAVLDLHTLEIRAVVAAPEGRRFHGHGAVSRDGRTLIVTENDLATLGGTLGIYDLSPVPRRIGTVPLPRPGPHDITPVAGTDRFHVALGGLMTHPDYGRAPLNAEDFASELVTFDLDRDGLEPMGQWTGAEGVSLRHLAADGHGRLYVGGQRPDGELAGVLWMVEDGRAQRLPAGDRLGGYVSSVAAHDGRALVTSKETGLALMLEAGQVVAEAARDGASAAALATGVNAMSGYNLLSLDGTDVPVAPGHEFDNHGLSLT